MPTSRKGVTVQALQALPSLHYTALFAAYIVLVIQEPLCYAQGLGALVVGDKNRIFLRELPKLPASAICGAFPSIPSIRTPSKASTPTALSHPMSYFPVPHLCLTSSLALGPAPSMDSALNPPSAPNSHLSCFDSTVLQLQNSQL